MSKRKKNNIIIGGLCAIVLLMAVGYAAFASQLRINGTSSISSEWKVLITDITSGSIVGGASNAAEPTHTETTATFSTNLESPGDSITYTITVANQGTIDATLTGIEVNTNNNPAIEFETSGIEEGNNLLQGASDELYVKVSYSNSVTSQPENTNSTITVTLNYEQATGAVVPGGETLTSEDLKALAVTEGDGLYADEYELGKYTYKGVNPNNYITFNNETWRIISVDSNGLIKIMRNESIGSRVFDSGNSNAWESSDIKTYLNGEYLATITENQDKIVPHTWSIGGVSSGNNDLADQINDENGTKSQPASVGLITVSEYLRANTNTEECGNLSLNNGNYSTCKTTDWMFNIVPSNDYLWTISPSASISSTVFGVNGSNNAGNVRNVNAHNSLAVSPVLYLSSDITLTGEGTGTSGDPYVITN